MAMRWDATKNYCRIPRRCIPKFRSLYPALSLKSCTNKARNCSSGKWNFVLATWAMDAKGRCGERSFISLCHHGGLFTWPSIVRWEQMAARPNSRLCGQIRNICQHRKDPGHQRDHRGGQHFLPTFVPSALITIFSCRSFTRDQCSLLIDSYSPGLQDIHSIINRFQFLRGGSTLVKSFFLFTEKD